MSGIIATDVFLKMSITDLIHTYGSGDDDYVIHPALQSALDCLGLSFDFMDLFKQNFGRSEIGVGDAYLYVSARCSLNRCFFDFYHETTDQLDIITLGFTADLDRALELRQASHRLFAEASYQIAYQEAAIHTELRRRIESNNYPIIKSDSGYRQQLHVFTSV
ncbi:MAG: hypothetical protein ACYDCO_25620 [Armatimonadota bacterium]